MTSRALVKSSTPYYGELKGGNAHGFGTIFCSNGPFYICNWKEGKFHGRGLHKYANGDSYYGEWFEGKRQGRGLYQYANGDSYYGDYCDGVPHGRGLYKYADGGTYDGEWYENTKHGRGLYKYADGSSYDGESLDGEYHGRGLYKFANGDLYHGEWFEGKQHGRGHGSCVDGDSYNGEWLEGAFHGRGVLKFADGGSYNGDFRDGVRHGRGLQKYANGSSYDGEWCEDKRHGRGLHKDDDGDFIYGKWIDGEREHDTLLDSLLTQTNQDSSGLQRILIVHADCKISALFSAYEGMTGKSPCRVKYKEYYIFYSQSKKKSLKHFGICNDDVVAVEVPVLTDISNDSMTIHSATTSIEKRKVAKTKRQLSRQRRPWAGSVIDVDSDRVKHSRRLNLVLKEIQPKLDTIRQHLHDLTLERTQPKDKTTTSKQAPANLEQIECRPISIGIGSKAGKGSFVVNVGEANNLYKTSKQSKLIRSNPVIYLDLHKHTKEQALAALNDSLPTWIETANSGMYPFVIQVRIVCGKGSQLLSEVVMRWINSQQQVAHAPQQKQ
eukprot:scaffold74946_cov46-Cyclotella_meneghiniana.AAC.3